MPIVTFDDIPIADKKRNQKPKIATFDDIPIANKEDIQKYGSVGIPNKVSSLKGQLRRKSLSFIRGLLEDVPGIRRILPAETQWERKGLTVGEKTIKSLTPFARDIGLWSLGEGIIQTAIKAPRLAGLVGIASKTAKGRMLTKAATEGAKAAFLGAATAGSENPLQIAKQAAIYGTAASSIPASMYGISKISDKLIAKSPAFIKKPITKVGKALGLVSKLATR